MAGLLVVEGLGGGAKRAAAALAPPRYPSWISLVGLVALLGTLVVTGRRRRA